MLSISSVQVMMGFHTRCYSCIINEDNIELLLKPRKLKREKEYYSQELFATIIYAPETNKLRIKLVQDILKDFYVAQKNSSCDLTFLGYARCNYREFMRITRFARHSHGDWFTPNFLPDYYEKFVSNKKLKDISIMYFENDNIVLDIR